MQESIAKLDLLPKGAFIIRLESGPVKGRFSMFALDRFATDKGITSYMQLIAKITLGMSIKEYAELVLYAIQDYYREDYTQCSVVIKEKSQRWTADLVMDQILEELGGLGNKTTLELFKHAVGRLSELVPEEEEEEEKKSQVNSPETTQPAES